MDKNRVKGKLDDAAGRVKRQVGEWTGDTETQAEGAAQQVKGKAEKAWGKMKDAARDIRTSKKRDVETEKVERKGKNEEVEYQRRKAL